MSEQENKPLTAVMREYVSKKVGCLSINSPLAKQQVAMLRRGVGQHPDDVPEIWGCVFEHAPQVLYGQGYYVSKAEECVYTALTLFAFASSGSHTVFSSNVSICDALSKLGYQEDSVKKYFFRLMTAKSFSELTFHIKQIVSLCKSHDIGLDYGLLAVEMYKWYAFDDLRKQVLRKWNKDFYRLNKEKGDKNHEK